MIQKNASSIGSSGVEKLLQKNPPFNQRLPPSQSPAPNVDPREYLRERSINRCSPRGSVFSYRVERRESFDKWFMRAHTWYLDRGGKNERDDRGRRPSGRPENLISKGHIDTTHESIAAIFGEGIYQSLTATANTKCLLLRTEFTEGTIVLQNRTLWLWSLFSFSLSFLFF